MAKRFYIERLRRLKKKKERGEKVVLKYILFDREDGIGSIKINRPEINLGIIPGGGGTQSLPRLVGLSSAVELIFPGEKIKSDKAEQIGQVNRVVPLERLEEETLNLAAKLMVL